MIRLIYNELYKIFHKKLIYILTGIVAVLYILVGILDYSFTNVSLDSMFVDTYKQTIATLDLSKESDAELYANLQPMVDVIDIANEKKLKENTPEKYYLDNTIYEELSQMYTAQYVQKDQDKYNELKSKVDADVASLDNFDWRKTIEDSIKDNKQLLEMETNVVDETSKETLKESIRVLEYRLNYNIPISNSDASNYLDSYVNSLTYYETMEKDEKKYTSKEKLYEKKQTESEIALGEYKIDNNLIKSNYRTDNAYSSFTYSFASVNLFVIVCILLVAGQIVAEEYSKGTIKQLLIRPYTRTRIVISKIIATFITVILFMIVVAVINALVSGIATGTLGTLFENNYLYNFATHEVFKTNIICESFMNFVAILPEIVIITLFTVLMSALVGNTALAVILGFVLTYIPQLFTAFVERIKVLSYLPMYNWDLSQYLYGGMSISKFASLPKSIIVDIVTIILLIIGIIIAFKKKEIKNQ